MRQGCFTLQWDEIPQDKLDLLRIQIVPAGSLNPIPDFGNILCK